MEYNDLEKWVEEKKLNPTQFNNVYKLTVLLYRLVNELDETKKING